MIDQRHRLAQIYRGEILCDAESARKTETEGSKSKDEEFGGESRAMKLRARFPLSYCTLNAKHHGYGGVMPSERR